MKVYCAVYWVLAHGLFTDNSSDGHSCWG